MIRGYVNGEFVGTFYDDNRRQLSAINCAEPALESYLCDSKFIELDANSAFSFLRESGNVREYVNRMGDTAKLVFA